MGNQFDTLQLDMVWNQIIGIVDAEKAAQKKKPRFSVENIDAPVGYTAQIGNGLHGENNNLPASRARIIKVDGDHREYIMETGWTTQMKAGRLLGKACIELEILIKAREGASG